MKGFVGNVPEKIVFGAGCLSELPKHVEGLGRKAILVTTKSSRPEKKALIDRVIGLLKQGGVDAVSFAEVEENPRTTTCDAGAEIARKERCDISVGLGGGSAMDAAKMIALAAASGGKAEDYIPGGKFCDKPESELSCLPIIEITTTSGTGSESTQFAVLTNPKDNNKPGIGYDFWFPTVSVVDPELTLSLPRSVTLNTGLDTFYHAFESYVCNVANPYADMFAEKAMETVVASLKKCLDNPGDIEARSQMAFANTMAGTAIALGGTYAIHGMAHSVSGHFDAAHGAALTAIAPAIMEFSCSGNIPKFAKAAVILGGDPQKTEEELALACRALFERFLDTLDAKITLKDLGVTEDKLRQMAEDAFFSMKGAMENTPVPITVDDAVELYRKSM